MRGLLIQIAAVSLIGAHAATAQVHDHGTPPKPATKDSGDAATAKVNAAMSGGVITVGSHITMTPIRPPAKGDSARAGKLVLELRAGLQKYKDVKVAEKDGFKAFAPNAKGQTVIHYTNRLRSLREAFIFNPSLPSSLLYKRKADGTMELVGAMYSAPARASLGQLDKRIPLSVARWHQHIDVCLPQKSQPARWLETRDGKPLFGPESQIATRKDCSLVGGRFMTHLFGWMVHVQPFSDDPKVVWGDHPGSEMAGHKHGG